MIKRLSGLLCLLLVALIPCGAMGGTKITMTFTGDVTLGGEKQVQGRSDSFTGFYNTYGPEYFLKNLRPLFENDDITLINFEGVLKDNWADMSMGKTYCFRAPTSYTDVLTCSSVEVCNLSNNHSKDFKISGLKSTQQALTDVGIQYTYHNHSAVMEVKGIKIGFVSETWVDVVNERDKLVADEARRLKREEGVSAVIASIHTGNEYSINHTHAQKYMAQVMLKAGADLVIQHHPHVLEGCEILNNRYVFYSLGNTCFGGNNEVRSLETAIVQVDFYFDDDGVYVGQQPRIYPAHTTGTYPRSNFQPVLMYGAEAVSALKLIQQDTKFQLQPFDETTGCVTQPLLLADGTEVMDEAPIMGVR